MDEHKKKRMLMIIVALILIAAAVIIFFIWRSRITATTMRILRLEGEVTLEDNGKPKPVKENLRLASGNALSTAVQSLVSIGLDDTKIVTLNERSRAEFNQSGRKLDLKLTEGSLYFEVSEPLTDEETFDIRTSTMVVGIRGTSGLVSVEGDHESLVVTDGMVHVIGTNPVTGEVKEIDVRAGQRIIVYLYNDRSVDSIEFYLEEVTEHDMPEFVLQYLRDNLVLLDKVVRETGWDREWILGIKKEDALSENTPVIKMPGGEGDGNPGDNGGPGGDGAPGGGGASSGGASSDEGTTGDDPADANDTVANGAAAREGSDTFSVPRNGPTKEQLERARHAIIFENPMTRVVALNVGTLFDPEWYADAYPDVAREYGTETIPLVAHYLAYGRREGRLPLPPVTITPTPTPTPVYVASTSNESPYDDDDEDEDDDDEPASTPAPPAGGGGGGGGGGTPPGSTGSFDSSSSSGPPFNVTFPGGVTGTYYSDINTIAITSNGSNLTLPITLQDSSHKTPDKTLSRLENIDWFSGAADTYSVTDGNGNTVTKNTTTPIYTLTRSDSTVDQTDSLSDLKKWLGGLP